MPLYHASPRKLAEGQLTPRTKNVILDQESGTARLSEYDDKNTPFVFAATDASFAATYAVPRGVRLGNYPGHHNIQLLLVEKESVIGDPVFHGGLYAFTDSGFLPLFNRQSQPTEQMVSAEAIDLTKSSFEPITGFNDLMKKSIQVYQIADHYSSDLFQAETRGLPETDFLKKIHSLQEKGLVRWLNEERAINPVQALLSEKDSAHKKTGPSLDEPALKI